MPADLLEFEEPLAPLLKEIDALSTQPRTRERQQALDGLQRRLDELRTDIYSRLTPWQRVMVARHNNDRRFADDHAIVAGFARYKDDPVMIIGHHKGGGGDTKQKVYRNFGYAKPEGYRKALRAMKLAEKFKRPVIAFIDTPAAYPGMESEERGISEAIAYNLREMAALDTPIVVIVHGEGGSGGALGIAIGDRILMHEFAIYSVIPPEGCAAILWRDSNRKVDAAQALKLTSPDLLRFGIIDHIVREPSGGAHTNHDLAATLLDEPLSRALGEVSAMNPADRLDARYRKFRVMGNIGIKES